MVKKTTHGPEGAKPRTRSTPQQASATRPATIPKKRDVPAMGQAAFVMHLDEDNLAVPAKKWIEDPGSGRKVPTYGVDSGPPPCVNTNYHEIVRAALTYVGRISAPQCQQAPDLASEWVLCRRLT